MDLNPGPLVLEAMALPIVSHFPSKNVLIVNHLLFRKFLDRILIFKKSFIFNFLYHNLHDKFDRKNNSIKSIETKWNHEKAQMLYFDLTKSLLSPRLELLAQGMVQHTNVQSQSYPG